MWKNIIRKLKNLNKKETVIAVLLWCLLCMIGTILGFNAKSYDIVEFSDDIVFTEEDISYVSGYKVAEDEYIPQNNDPQLGFVELNECINSIWIQFEQAIVEDIYIQVYYAEPGNGLAEPNSVGNYVEAGEDDIIIFLPTAVYSELRIDINGEFLLESIQGSPEQPTYKKILELTDIVIGVVFGTIFFCIVVGIFRKKDTFLHSVKLEDLDNIKSNGILVGVFLTLAIVWGGLFGYTLLTYDLLEKNWFVFLLVWTGLLIIVAFCFLWKVNMLKCEIIFSIICVLIGCYLSVTMPLGTVGWDDETHYKRALVLSHLFDDEVSVAETKYITHGIENVQDIEIMDDLKMELDDIHDNTFVSLRDRSINFFASLNYLPSAIFLFLARCFSMPFHAVYFMGRLGMVFVYAFLVYQAIKRLKSGKVILATIALIPTNLFLCATYSYDPWVTGFTMLGLSIIISELQQPDKAILVKDIVIMLGSFLLVGSAKAIYFPLVALAFLVKPSKFANTKQYKAYLLSVCGVIVALILSFILPMFFSSTQYVGDTRGGSDVNGTQQMLFILKNPIEYAKILLNFLKSYLSVNQSQGYMTFFAYLGHGAKFEILLILLGIVAFTDKNEYDLNLKWGHKCVTFGIVFVTAVLVATSLYITFTPVALPTINGCQPRYIMPIVFPILYMIGSSGVLNKINTSRYMGTVFGVELYVICCTIWKTCISLYM